MLGDRVRELREARAWTQEHLADAAGVSLRTVQRLESGSGFASETALAVAAALDVDVRTLLGATPRSVVDPPWKPVPTHVLVPIGVIALAVLLLPAILYVADNLFRLRIATPEMEMFHSPANLIGGPLLVMLAIWGRKRGWYFRGRVWLARTLTQLGQIPGM